MRFFPVDFIFSICIIRYPDCRYKEYNRIYKEFVVEACYAAVYAF